MEHLGKDLLMKGAFTGRGKRTAVVVGEVMRTANQKVAELQQARLMPA